MEVATRTSTSLPTSGKPWTERPHATTPLLSNNEVLSVPVDVSNGIPQDVLVEVAAYEEDDTFRGAATEST